MKIKMIASDMDDTLLNNERKISPRNLAAIKRALAAGIVFTLATGRCTDLSSPLLNNYNWMFL